MKLPPDCVFAHAVTMEFTIPLCDTESDVEPQNITTNTINTSRLFGMHLMC